MARLTSETLGSSSASSSSGEPENRNGDPNQRWYFTGSGSGTTVGVMGSAGKPIALPT